MGKKYYIFSILNEHFTCHGVRNMEIIAVLSVILGGNERYEN